MFTGPAGAGVGGRFGSRVFTSILVALVAACEDPQPPAACGAIPPVTIHTGESATVSACFSDPNEDMLTYSAMSSNAGVATASLAGTDITVRAVAPGNASVTVTATDPDGLQGRQSFQVMVPNRPPLARGAIPPITVAVDSTVSVDASSYFTEPDGEVLTYSATSSNSAVATVAVSGSTVSVTAIAKGLTTVTVTASDPGGLGTTQDFRTMVPNRQPVPAGTIPEQTVEVGEPVSVDLSPYFDDPDGDTLTYAARSSGPGLATVSVTGSTLVIAAVAKGTTTVTVTATDPEGLEATQTFQSTIPNRPPGPTGTIPEQTLYIGDTVTVDLSPYFDDPDGDALMYAAASTNSGVVTASASGSTLVIAAGAKGTATVTVTATDPEGLAATQTLQSTIPNRPPGPTGTIPEQTFHLGDTVTVDLSPYFDDPDGDALMYAAGSSDSGVATASVSGSNVVITAVARGTTTVSVTAIDPEGLTATQTFEATVPNRPPGPVGTVPDQTLYTGDTVTVDLSPYFEDLDGDALTYTASSTNSAVATASVSGSTVAVTAAAQGTTTVTVTAADPEGLTATQIFESVVPNRPPAQAGRVPDQTVRAEETITVDLAPSFEDPDGDALTYSATSSNTAVATASVAASLVTITGAAAGSATITVTARDPDGLTATQQVGVTVRPANRAPRPVRRIPSRRLAPGRTATINASRHFADPDDDALTYSASSSNSGVARVSVSGATVRISAVGDGSSTVTVTARDPSGLTATQRASVRVQTNRAPQPAGTIPALELAPAETATVDASRYFNDPDGDVLAYTVASSDSSVAAISASGSVVTITAVADGSATITVTAEDPDGLTATQDAGVTVARANRAPRPVGSIPPMTLDPGETAGIDASGYFTDPDGDGLTYTAVSSSPGVVTASVAGSIVTVGAVAAGSATITVTAHDPGGLTATQRTDITVTRGDRGFRDDFSSSASLDDWSLTRATAEVNNGVLELTQTDPPYTGTASRDLATPITSWTLAVRMGRGQPSDSAVALAWRTGHPQYTFAGFFVMEDNNYFLLAFDSDAHDWIAITDASGTSDAINAGAGELTTISISFIDGRLKGVAESTELFNYQTNGLGSAIFARVGYGSPGTALRLFADGVAGSTASFDWIDVSGDPVENSLGLHESAALSGIDAHEFPKVRPASTLPSTKSLDVFRVVRKARNR